MSGGSQRWAQALAQLEQLLDGRLLDPLKVSVCLTEAQDVRGAGGSLGPVPDGHMRQRLSRAVGMLGEQLRQLDAAPAIPLAHGVVLSGGQQTAALLTSEACLGLMEAAELGGQELTRLAAGITTLVFGSGRRLVELGNAADSPDAFCAKCQLSAMIVLLRVLGSVWAADIRPAVARQASKPGGLLPWVVAVERAVQAAAAMPGTGETAHGMQARLGAHLIDVLNTFLLIDTELKARLAADHHQQRQLSAAILRVVTRMVQQADEEAGDRPTSSGSGSGGSGSSRTAAAGAQQAQQARQGDGGQTREWWHTVFTGLDMLTDSLVGGTSHHASHGGQVQLLVPATVTLRLVLAGGPGLPSTRRPLLCVVALKLASAAVCDGIGTNAGGANPAVVTALLRIAPEAVAAIEMCASDGVCAPDGFDLGCVLWLSWLVLQVVPHTREGAGQLADWCRAADAFLRLLPLLCAVHAKWRGKTIQGPLVPALPAPQAHPSRGAEVLAGVAFESWGHLLAQVPAFMGPAEEGQREAAAAEEAEPLWQLHSTVCRLLHWAATRSREQLAVLPSLSDWEMLNVCASRALVFAMEGCRTWLHVASGRPEEAAQARRRIQAICAAHSQVLPLLANRLGLPLEELAASSPADTIRWHGIVAATPPVLLTPGLLSASQHSLRRGMQGHFAMQQLRAVLGYAVEWLPSAAQQLSSGLLAQGLGVIEGVGLPPPRLREAFEEVRRMFNDVYLVCVNMAAKCDAQLRLGGSSGIAALAGDGGTPPAGSGAAGNGGSGSSSSSRPAVEAGLAALQAAIEKCKREGGGQGAPPTLALRLYQHTLIPPATQLAQALQVWWAEPEQQAAQQLEAAQVAATRSCAYLCCANLGTTAGPAAGPGQGTKRCSSCRTAWYCGTACSGADWRAGHRRVCKALAAARQQGCGGKSGKGRGQQWQPGINCPMVPLLPGRQVTLGSLSLFGVL